MGMKPRPEWKVSAEKLAAIARQILKRQKKRKKKR
jgi:hypothetical protein